MNIKDVEKTIQKDKDAFISEWLANEKTGYTESDLEKMYDEMLDEVSGDVVIGSLRYSASRVLAEIDPTAYRCGYSDWLDGAAAQIQPQTYFDSLA